MQIKIIITTQSGYYFYDIEEQHISSKVGDLSWGWPEGSFFKSYYIKA